MTRLVITALVITAPALAAAAPAPRVHTDTHEVRACLPVAGGALIGTGGGLALVDGDGVTRRVWTASDGLPGTRIETVVADGDDLWIGADGGAARLRLGGGGRADGLEITRTVAGHPVRDLARHGDALYAATWGGGVRKLGARGDGVAVAFRGGTRGARDRVAALAVSDGALWAGGDAGLFVLRGARLQPVALDGGGAVTSLHAEGARLWIATVDGLFVRERGQLRHLGGGHLTRVTALDGAIVVAGLGDGLRAVDRGRLVRLDDAPRELVHAQAIAATTTGGAACAGGLEGLWLRAAATDAWAPAARPVELPSNDVSALALDGDRLWVGSFDHGLAVRERGTWRPVHDPDLDARINALLVEPRPGRPSRLWVGTAAGLMTVDGDEVARLTRRDGLPGRSVLSLARLRDGRIVAGTSTGAVIVRDGRPEPVGPPGTEIGNVWAIAEDADGLLWLGTTTGAWRGPSAPVIKAGGDRDGGWQRMSVASGHLDDDWVMAFAVRDRAVWIGGYKSGVVRVDLAEGAGALPATAATRLGGGWVNPGGLSWDGDALQAATQDGLMVGDGATASWRATPGLPGKDVTAVTRAGRTRWVATRRGLAEGAAPAR